MPPGQSRGWRVWEPGRLAACGGRSAGCRGWAEARERGVRSVWPREFQSMWLCGVALRRAHDVRSVLTLYCHCTLRLPHRLESVTHVLGIKCCSFVRRGKIMTTFEFRVSPADYPWPNGAFLGGPSDCVKGAWRRSRARLTAASRSRARICEMTVWRRRRGDINSASLPCRDLGRAVLQF